MSDDDTFRWGDEDYEFAEEFFMPDSPSDEEYEMEYWDAKLDEIARAKKAKESEMEKSEGESEDQSGE